MADLQARVPGGDPRAPADLGGDPRTPADPGGDRDVPVSRVLLFVGAIFGIIGVAAALCVLLYSVVLQDLVAKDPPPSPLPEANAPVIPPEPRLQESPARDMIGLRARESAVLEGYGWVDRDAGTGRIPIERAIELTLDPGLRPPRREGGAGGGDPDGGAP